MSSSPTVETSYPDYLLLPDLIVFDLDMCLWSPEMYTLDTIPTSDDKVIGSLLSKSSSSLTISRDSPTQPNSILHQGVVAVKSGYEEIRLFPAALTILQQFYSGYYGPTMRIAAASSADTPLAVSIGRAAMNLLEVFPGVTMRQAFAKGWPIIEVEGEGEGKLPPQLFEGNLQIGRTAPLTVNKATSHFPRLRELTGIEYNKMVFFDDCLWGDHCANVAKLCPGVVTQRTPRGLQMKEWETALQIYHHKYSSIFL